MAPEFATTNSHKILISPPEAEPEGSRLGSPGVRASIPCGIVELVKESEQQSNRWSMALVLLVFRTCLRTISFLRMGPRISSGGTTNVQPLNSNETTLHLQGGSASRYSEAKATALARADLSSLRAL